MQLKNPPEKTMFMMQKGILFFCAFLLAAPYWTPFFKELNGRRLFLTADSMMALGLTLVIGYLGSRMPVNGLPQLFEKMASGARKYWKIAVVAGLGFILAGLYLVNQKVLHAFMNSADEHSCLFLAESFRMGRWWIESHPLSEFFNVVHVGNRDGKWFSVYPPGWPLLMALGIQWNVLDWMNPVLTITALFFIFKTGSKVYGFSASLLGVILWVVTPYFAFTGASYFSHSTCLLTISIFSYAFVKWGEARDPKVKIIWAAILALAVGYGLMTRYLTMAAFAAPFLLYRFWPVLRRREKWGADHSVIVGILAAAMLLIYYQNYMVTGKFYKAPNRYDKSWEKLGFSDEYSILDGLIFLLARSFYLMDWTPPVILILFLASLLRRREQTVTQALFRYAYFYPVIAYFFYFSWGGNQYGPRYYYEGFPFLLLALGDAAVQLWRDGTVQFRKWMIAIFMVTIGVSAYQFTKHGTYFEEASRQRKALYKLAEDTLDKPSIVFIRGFLGQRLVMSQDDAIRNKPSLNEKVLYARDMGTEKNRALQDYYPEREHYIGYFDRSTKAAKLEPIGAEA